MARNAPKGRRPDEGEIVATQLSVLAHRLSRFLIKEIADERISFTEASLLGELRSGPCRVTELAARVGVAQPTGTALVKDLEADGLVRRVRHDTDQRVVLVEITEAGTASLEQLRAHGTALLRGYLDVLADDQVSALAAAMPALAELVGALRQ